MLPTIIPITTIIPHNENSLRSISNVNLRATNYEIKSWFLTWVCLYSAILVTCNEWCINKNIKYWTMNGQVKLNYHYAWMRNSFHITMNLRRPTITVSINIKFIKQFFIISTIFVWKTWFILHENLQYFYESLHYDFEVG